MKTLLAVIFILSSTQVWAGSDFLANIGQGTQIEVTNNVSFPPNSMVYHIKDSCIITLKTKEAFGRVLKAGKVLTVKATKTENFKAHGNWYRKQSVFVDNMNIASINCIDDVADSNPTTVEKFGKLSSHIFKTKLAVPEEI